MSANMIQYVEGRRVSHRENATLLPEPLSPFTPNVTFPTQEEIFAYLREGEAKSEFAIIGNNSLGEASNVVTALNGNMTWVAWQASKADGLNRVFLAVSFNEGYNFTDPIQLSPPNAGNATELQLAITDDGSEVFVVWQDTNITDGKRTVYYSTSMNWGQDFKSYSLNLPGEGEFIEPRLTVANESVFLTWIAPGNETVALRAGPGGEGDCEVCGHGRRW